MEFPMQLHICSSSLEYFLLLVISTRVIPIRKPWLTTGFPTGPCPAWAHGPVLVEEETGWRGRERREDRKREIREAEEVL